MLDNKTLIMAITVVDDTSIVAPVINPIAVAPFTFQIDEPPPLHSTLPQPYPPIVPPPLPPPLPP